MLFHPPIRPFIPPFFVANFSYCVPYITFVCYRKFEKRTEERWLSSLTLFYKRMDGTTNLEGFKKSWPCLKLIFSCSKEAIHFQFSFLPMHPLLVKNLVWIVLWGRLKALSTVIGVRSRWRSWIRLLVYTVILYFSCRFYDTFTRPVMLRHWTS